MGSSPILQTDARLDIFDNRAIAMLTTGALKQFVTFAEADAGTYLPTMEPGVRCYLIQRFHDGWGLCAVHQNGEAAVPLRLTIAHCLCA
jgi:hypothetical protein